MSLKYLQAKEMGSYLVSKGLSKGSKVSEFKFVNINFRWQGVGYGGQNCGTYAMIHMLLYNGAPFECGLGTMDVMNLLRAEIAAILVLSDINKSRNDVLSAVKASSAEKNVICAASKRTDSFKTPPTKRKADCQASQGTTKRPRSNRSVSTKPGAKSSGASLAVNRNLSAIKSPLRGKGDGLGCSLDCGEADCVAPMSSKIWRDIKQSLVKGLPKLRKHIADFCFDDDYNLDPR